MHCKAASSRRDNLLSETTIVWDSKTGEPLYNAIVWLDSRTSDLAEQSIARTPSRYLILQLSCLMLRFRFKYHLSCSSKDEFKEKTGLPIHPYFSALKIKWLMENVDEVKKACAEGELLRRSQSSLERWSVFSSRQADVWNS